MVFLSRKNLEIIETLCQGNDRGDLILYGGVGETIKALNEDYNSLKLLLENIPNIATRQDFHTFDILLDVVLAGKRPDCPNDSKHQVISRSRGGVIEVWVICWICGPDDGRIIISRAVGQALPQLFSDKWHEGVNHRKSTLKTSVKSILSRTLLL